MPTRSLTVLAWSLWVLYVVFEGASLLLLTITDPATLTTQALYGLAALGFPTVGALVATRRPENAIGWLFCLAPLLTVFGVFAEEYFVYALVLRPGSLPAALPIGWLGSWLGNLGFVVLLTFTLLLFPTGRLPSPRWRPLALLAGGVVAMFTIARAFQPGPIEERVPEVPNPVGLAPFAGLFAAMDRADWVFLMLIALCAASVVVRFHRAQGVERQQLKWFAYAASLVLVIFSLFTTVFEEDSTWLPAVVGDLLFALALAVVPAAAGVAILRYRLYDIDLIIRRTLVYGALTGALAVVYLAGVVLLQGLFQSLTGQESNLAIVIATLLSAALFVPLRRQVQGFIDHRFYRRKYDATRTLAAFSTHLRDEVDLTRLSEELVRVVDETMRPSHVSLWLRSDDGRPRRQG